MASELEHLIGKRVWLTDADGNTVHRDDLLNRIAEELNGVEESSVGELIATIKADPRKSFSKKKIIELIEEWA